MPPKNTYILLGKFPKDGTLFDKVKTIMCL